MRPLPASIIGGLIAGVATTALMTVARKSGVFGRTLDRDAVDWIDDVAGSRAVIGDAGTSVVEFANHLAASAAFAAAWPTIRKSAPGLPAPLLAAGYGTALYAINIGAIAPALGITEGEIEAGPRKAAERWTVHVVQTVVIALIADRLADTSG